MEYDKQNFIDVKAKNIFLEKEICLLKRYIAEYANQGARKKT